VRFWKNIWCGDCFLKDLCPNLFDLAVDKDALVSSYLAGHWNPHFIWLFQDWELEAFHMFLGAPYDNLPTSFGQDQALWFGIKERVYEVGSCYNVLRVPTRVSNGRASGRLRFQERWHFLCGLWPFEEF